MQQLELFPEDIRIERVDPDLNMYRFYRLRLQPDLFGGMTLFREWGRIGTGGRQMVDHFNDTGTAIDALLEIYRTKSKRGYTLPGLCFTNRAMTALPLTPDGFSLRRW